MIWKKKTARQAARSALRQAVRAAMKRIDEYGPLDQYKDFHVEIDVVPSVVTVGKMYGKPTNFQCSTRLVTYGWANR